MTLSDLTGKIVRRQTGERLGKVFEVRIRHGEVLTLVCGAGGLWQRLTGSRKGRRVAWKKVQRITGQEIWID